MSTPTARNTRRRWRTRPRSPCWSAMPANGWTLRGKLIHIRPLIDSALGAWDRPFHADSEARLQESVARGRARTTAPARPRTGTGRAKAVDAPAAPAIATRPPRATPSWRSSSRWWPSAARSRRATPKRAGAGAPRSRWCNRPARAAPTPSNANTAAPSRNRQPAARTGHADRQPVPAPAGRARAPRSSTALNRCWPGR